MLVQAENVETWGFKDRNEDAKKLRTKAEALGEIADEIERYEDD